MIKTLYPQMGSTIKYIRQNVNSEIETGSGVVVGLALDPNKRLIVHIEKPLITPGAPADRINVDLLGLNPTRDYIELYTNKMKEIKTLSNEGNDKMKRIMDQYNGLVEDLYSTILGQPIEFVTANETVIENSDDS